MFPLLFLGTSVIILVALYVFDADGQDSGVRMIAFSLVILLFIVIGTLVLFRQANAANRHFAETSSDSSIDEHLKGLEEAREFFSGILSKADAFRIVASRVKGIYEFKTIVLYLFDPDRSAFIATNAVGSDREAWLRKTWSKDESIALTALMPLVNKENTFGMIQLVFESDAELRRVNADDLEAIGSRAAPLLYSATGFERTTSNALTDQTTELPNERAFFMFLENQVAEAQRSKGERPLAILAVDIKKFDEYNRRFGHVAGNRLLGYAAGVIRENLRTMDFLARSDADEFLAILPTADSDTCEEIILRLETSLAANALVMPEIELAQIDLNFGWAVFGRDGETPQTLLRAARSRKLVSKDLSEQNVLRFPQEVPIDASSR